MKTPSIVSGKSVLRKFLQSERANLSQSPVLIVSSAVSNHAPSKVAAVDTACRKLEFHASMEFGLNTVESKVTSVFPTVENVHAALAVARRTGASTIIGVGSGAAMDLTKAILQESDMNGILVPSTSGAIMAAASSHPLLLDTREEALIIPEHDNTSSASACSDEATIVVETNTIANVHEKDAVYASLAIGVDAIIRGQQDLELSSSDLDFDGDYSDLLLKAGTTLSYGISQGSVRSSPLALAASLIPTSFPNASMMTFMASLLPGIMQVTSDDAHQVFPEEAYYENAPSLASLMVRGDDVQSVESLMSQVKANRALWNCIDLDDNILEAILHYSLNR